MSAGRITYDRCLNKVAYKYGQFTMVSDHREIAFVAVEILYEGIKRPFGLFIGYSYL